MNDTITLITAVFQAYQFIHPEAGDEEVDAWDAALNADDKPAFHAMEEYAEVCTECLVQVFQTGDKRNLSMLDLVIIAGAAGHYSAASEGAKRLEEVQKIAIQALRDLPDDSGDCDNLLTALG
jgi:hypothetical protein